MSAPLIGEEWQSRLRELQPNWDLDGSAQISEAAIATVERFATVPCSDGGIQIELHKDGWDLEIAISPDGTLLDVIAERVPVMGAEA